MEQENTAQMRDVLITINSFQSVDGKGDTLEFITQGKYLSDKDGIRFYYNESELTGLVGTRTDFLVTDDSVIMSREGSVNSRMVFHEGQKHQFTYDTPYGALNMKLDTFRIHRALDERGGKLEIEYDLDLEHSVISRNRFKINVRDLKGN